MLFNQPNWRWCGTCQGLFFGPEPAGRCPSDGQPHDPTSSGAYVAPNLSMSSLNAADPALDQLGQQGWRYCCKCQGMFLIDSARRPCATGGLHDPGRSGAYVLATATAVDRRYCGVDFQAAWRRCLFCASLFFSGNVPPGTPFLQAGACPGVEGGHIGDTTTEYLLRPAGPLDVHAPATLLILAPQPFLAALEPLVEHKNATGMPTLMADVRACIDQYEGRDDAVMLKRAIQYAVECLGTQYVLLVGDGSLVPLRYRWERFDATPEQWRDGVYSATDLYFSNLYRDHQREPDGAILHGEWSDWDGDGDGRYNFQDFANDTATVNPDRVDGYCDVAVGRLPTHDVDQVSTYVSKVIDYENGLIPSPQKSLTIVVDGYYDSWPGCESEIETRTPLPSLTWPDVDRVGYNFTATNPIPSGWRDVDGDALGDVTGSGVWLVYVGHGSYGGWDVPGSDADSVAAMAPGGNTPVVLAVGCATGQLAPFAPDGPPRYVDTSGRPHWYWTLPVGSARPTRIVDFGPNDPEGGYGTPVQSWDAAPDGTLTPITPAEPNIYQSECPTVAQPWLFTRPDTGAIVYFGEQTVAQNNWGTVLAGEMLHAAADGSLTTQTVGDLWSAAARAYWAEYQHLDNAIGNPRIYLSYMTMYGDPSLRTRPFATATIHRR